MNYLYKITNSINGKIYIGVHKTENINDGYMGSGTAITHAINKYGVENFKKEIISEYETYEEALIAESEIVNEDFVLRADTYNLKVGGLGGFDHINRISKEIRPNLLSLNELRQSGVKLGGTKFWTDESKERMLIGAKKGAPIATEKALSEESRRKRIATFANTQHQQGSKNSQFGRRWISNVLTKEVTRINADETIPDGWVIGKKGHVLTKCWINNGNIEKYIQIDKKQEFLEKGFSSGRLKTSVPQNRIVV